MNGDVTLRGLTLSPDPDSDYPIEKPDLFPAAESRSNDQALGTGVAAGRDSVGGRTLLFNGILRDSWWGSTTAMAQRAALAAAFDEGSTDEVLTFEQSGQTWAYFGRPRGLTVDVDSDVWTYEAQFVATSPFVYGGTEVHLEDVTSTTIDPVGVRDSSAYRFVIPPCTSPQIALTALDGLAGLSQVAVGFPGLVVPALHTLVVDGMGMEWGTPCAYIDGPGGKTYVTEQAVEVGTGKLGRLLPFTHLGCTFQFEATGATECDVYYRACFG
jgi:hypothetical protein